MSQAMSAGAFDQVSNRATWTEAIELIDDDTGELLNISAATEIIVEIREPRTFTPVLTASLANGKVTRPSLGVFQWKFTSDEMRTLCALTYEVGATLTMAGDTEQIVIGTLPVLDGVVS